MSLIYRKVAINFRFKYHNCIYRFLQKFSTITTASPPCFPASQNLHIVKEIFHDVEFLFRLPCTRLANTESIPCNHSEATCYDMTKLPAHLLVELYEKTQDRLLAGFRGRCRSAAIVAKENKEPSLRVASFVIDGLERK